MSELILCPFCKHAVEVVDDAAREFSHHENTSWVECFNCGATGPRAESREEAITAWNRAAQPVEPYTLYVITPAFVEQRKKRNGYSFFAHTEIVDARYEDADHIRLTQISVVPVTGVVSADEFALLQPFSLGRKIGPVTDTRPYTTSNTPYIDVDTERK